MHVQRVHRCKLAAVCLAATAALGLIWRYPAGHSSPKGERMMVWLRQSKMFCIFLQTFFSRRYNIM